MAEIPGEDCCVISIATDRSNVSSVLLCPYLDESEDAPATAKRGDEKKVFSAASMSASRFCPRVVGM